MEHWSECTRFFTALLVILDPFMAIPILLAMTEGYSSVERSRVVRIAALTVAAVLVIMALLGETMLHWLGTGLGSFRVGGGIVLFSMALAMLQAQVDRVRTSPSEERSAAGRASIAVVPIAIPLLAGPGAMSIVIMSAAGSFWILRVAECDLKRRGGRTVCLIRPLQRIDGMHDFRSCRMPYPGESAAPVQRSVRQRPP